MYIHGVFKNNRIYVLFRAFAVVKLFIFLFVGCDAAFFSKNLTTFRHLLSIPSSEWCQMQHSGISLNSPPDQTGPGAHPASYTMDTGSLFNTSVHYLINFG
jgi:hypothetical protein